MLRGHCANCGIWIGRNGTRALWGWCGDCWRAAFKASATVAGGILAGWASPYVWHFVRWLIR
jgi:hypothetical protein